MLAAGERALDQPRRVVEVVAQPLAPAGGQLHERLDLERLAAHRPRGRRFLSGRTPRDPLAQDVAIEQVLHAQAESARRGRRRSGRCPRPVVPTLASPSRDSLARSRATWYGMITCALRLTRTRLTSMPRAASMSSSSMSVTGLTTTPLPMTDVMCGYRTPDGVSWSLNTSSPLDHGVAGVVAALVADDHRDLLGQEVGRLALALVAPLEPDDHGSRHQARSPRSRAPTRKSPGPCGPGPDRHLPRRAADCVGGSPVVWSLARLTGRPMRPASAIADLLLRGSAPARGRGRPEYSRPTPASDRRRRRPPVPSVPRPAVPPACPLPGPATASLTG